MASAAVNKPTDTKLRDRDIDRKLQLYGIFNAFANGKVPSNQQIDVAMNSALAWQPMANPPSKLSSEGRHLVADLRDVIEQAKVLLLSKNDGNLIQDFTWQTRHLDQGSANGMKAPIDKQTAQQHGNEALEGLRTLGQLIITNGQFRKLLKDSTVLLRDMAGDAAQKAANKVNPSEDELNQIDQPEEDHVWHDAPDLSRENIKQQAQSRAPIGKGQAQNILGNATQAAHPSGARDPRDAASRDQQSGHTGGVDPRQGARQGIEDVKSNMDEDQKQKLREQRERANNYLNEKVPKERRDQAIFRLKKMVVEIQDHSDYQQAIDSLLRLAEEYQGHTKDLTKQGASNVKGARDQSSLQNAETDLKTILERFANGSSFDDLIDSINQIYRDADRDPDLKNWFRNMDNYVRKCLKQQGFILEDRATEEYNQLHDQGHFLLRERYKQHTDRVTDELKYLADQFDQDSQNKKFAQSMEKLFNDLGRDENGQQTFKPHLLEDLRDVIIPGFFQSVGYIPIPRIEYSDPMIDAVIENLVLEGDNIAPNVFEFGTDNYFKWTRGTSKEGSKNRNNAMLAVEGIQMDIRDVAYYIKKKEGFPGVTDKGVMDIFFGGSGISFKVAMETADNKMGKSGDNAHFFKIKTVVVSIEHMDIKLKQSNHKLLFNIFKPLLFKVIKPVVQKVVEKQIRDNVAKLDAMCYRAKQEADRAAESARRNPDPDNVQSMYQRYWSALQNQITKGQQKKEEAKEAAADKQFNVAPTQHESIFKNIQLPGGFSTIATKYKDQARQGEKWQSPVFGIGSAAPSRNIQPKQITRRGGGDRSLADRTVGDRGIGNQGYSDTQRSGQNTRQYVGYDQPHPSATRDVAGGTTGAAGTSEFADRMNSAFDSKYRPEGAPTPLGTDYPVLFSGGPGAGTGTGGALNSQSGGGTYLGSNNPVMRGDAR